MNLKNEEITTLNYYFNKLNTMFENDNKVKAITEKESDNVHEKYRESDYSLYRLTEDERFILTAKQHSKAEYDRARLEINNILVKI